MISFPFLLFLRLLLAHRIIKLPKKVYKNYDTAINVIDFEIENNEVVVYCQSHIDRISIK